MSYLQDLQWRYAAKRMNGEAVPEGKLHKIQEAIRLAPTSLGLQPFDIILIKDLEIRKKLAPAINNQAPVTEGAALIVFTAWKSITPEKIDHYLQNIATTRNTTVDALAGLKQMIENNLVTKTPDQLFQWSARQAYIALAYATVAAAFEKVDTTPMEGFNPAEVDRILGLEEKGLSAVSILAVGYRDHEKDHLANAPKVRRPAEQLFTLYEN